jgi:excisionase family DNA binding protein
MTFHTKVGGLDSSAGDPWLSTKQAAKYLNCHPSTLEKMRCRGEGPAYRKLGGKAVRYRKSSLDLFMEAGDDC